MNNLENSNYEEDLDLKINDSEIGQFGFDNTEVELKSLGIGPKSTFNNLVDDIREEGGYSFYGKTDIRICGEKKSVLMTKVTAENGKKYKKIKIGYTSFPNIYNEYNLRYNKKTKKFEESSLIGSRKSISQWNAKKRINEIIKIIRHIRRENGKRDFAKRIFKQVF